MAARYLTFALASLAAWPLPAAAQPGATEPSVTGEQVRRDLESIFEPGASLDSNVSPYQQTAARARLGTRPYATSVLGICRRDEVIVDYGGPRPFANNAAANAVAPFGVSAESWYRVLRYIPYASYDGPAREGECTRLSGTETRGWFVAPDVYAAADGHRAFAAAIARLNRPDHSVPGCSEGRQARTECRRLFSAGSFDLVTRIDRCPARPRHFCYRSAMTDDGGAIGATLEFEYDNRLMERFERVTIQYQEISI